MVVVPTATEVDLRYGTTPVEWLAWALTAFGIGGLVLLVRRGAVPMATRRTDSDEGDEDGDGADTEAAAAPPDHEREERRGVLVAAGDQAPPDGRVVRDGQAAPNGSAASDGRVASEGDEAGLAAGDDGERRPDVGNGSVAQPVAPPGGRIWGPSGGDADPAG
jgi:hypothetical protein